jgi:hypothetical protein
MVAISPVDRDLKAWLSLSMLRASMKSMSTWVRKVHVPTTGSVTKPQRSGQGRWGERYWEEMLMVREARWPGLVLPCAWALWLEVLILSQSSLCSDNGPGFTVQGLLWAAHT